MMMMRQIMEKKMRIQMVAIKDGTTWRFVFDCCIFVIEYKLHDTGSHEVIFYNI